MTADSTSADVIIVGAGLAGATAAILLARAGARVILVDRRPTFPPCFKAEKIEPDQIELFRKFGLMDVLLPRTGSIREVIRIRSGRVLRRVSVEQYGIFYHDMVNALRSAMPRTVDVKVGSVQEIATDPDVQRVTLTGGEELTARLVVLASGTGGSLQARLGLQKRMIRRDQSVAFGFTLARRDGKPFTFDSVTCYSDNRFDGLAYLTLFPIGTAMRANMFTFWSSSEESTRSFIREPGRELARLLPALSDVIAEFEVVSSVEYSKIDLYRVEGELQPGLVLVADAFQSVCPTTGSGLSKVLTDVDVLCNECVPNWLATPGMGVEKIASFYENARKQRVDTHSLRDAQYARQISMDASLPWRLRRLKWRWENQLEGWRDYFRFTKKATA